MTIRKVVLKCMHCTNILSRTFDAIKCVLINFIAVHGGLSAWSTFSPCSLSCGKGTQTRFKTCTNPTPMYGGNPCEGIMNESKECQLIECPGKSFNLIHICIYC